ncbi:MAG: hypothetical protein ABIN94_15170 [Ferruginibacter sp.]
MIAHASSPLTNIPAAPPEMVLYLISTISVALLGFKTLSSTLIPLAPVTELMVTPSIIYLLEVAYNSTPITSFKIITNISTMAMATLFCIPYNSIPSAA